MEWNGTEWNGMERNGMEWNEMEWIGMESNGKTPFQEKNFYALELTDYFSIIVIS